ncbi:CHAT domain-containing protein [Russula earlei]|uniref:CHAT domain-containing protein n=1 Tax=Russula earlei TaxID=71964 RepID=A0ACC0TWS5_9AGAM|nr:CHAT domain-containing protein [Russula earlei]
MQGALLSKPENPNLLRAFWTGTHDILQQVGADIERCRTLSPFFPRPHPLRPCILSALGSALYCRYLISRQEDDLFALIPLFAEALLLPLGPLASRVFHTTKIFYKLACSLSFRFELYRSPEDLECAVRHYRLVLALPPRAIVEIDSLEVLHNLTTLLAHKVRTETEVQPDLAEEVVRIYRKSAATDPSSGHIGRIAQNIGHILVARLSQIDQSAECEQAIMRFNRGLALLPREHPLRPLAQMGVATVLHHRFTHDKQLESLEEAIRHSRAVLGECPPGHPLRPACLALLSGSLRWRYAFFGNAEFLQEADTCVREALSEEIPEPLRVAVTNVIDESNTFIGGFQRDDSLEGLEEEIRLQKERVARIPLGHSDQLDALRSLALACGAKFQRTQKLADLEEEINCHSVALAAAPPGNYVRRMSLFNLGKVYQKRFILDPNDARYLDESIACCRDALESSPRGQMSRFVPLQTLALSLSLRSFALSRKVDFEESMALFQSAFEEEYAHPHARCEIASQWAACARGLRHPLTTLAYEKAISLMQSSLAIGPTLEVQHRLLRGRWGPLSAVPLECASYHIEMGSLERAVESLEQGRALLWSEMRGLRTPIDQLQASDNATLAGRFVAINEELENIATSAQAPEIDPEGRAATLDDHYSRPDGFSQMMENVRKLERKRVEIIDQIRLVPGFKDFLKAVPFGTLKTAAARGPVIIINHCRYRSDILIVVQNFVPVLIPTAEDFYTRTTELKRLLLETRTRHSLNSPRYEQSLRFVLQELYDLVGRPVIENLRKLGIPEQSRIWWCPTSVFCSLPLHAAGPIEAEDGVEQYFSDVYVSSYTPSLAALIESRKGMTGTLETPSLLIVGQPDLSLPGVKGEIMAIQRRVPSAVSLIGAEATRASVMEHLPNHRMVHFACHGSLDLERPFETAFLLHRDERLTVLDMVRSQVRTAECAFLSVCHAAEWTDGHTPDEALHLTAAMQHCGFRSVVGTMWAMADVDGREVSRDFYGRMFGEEEPGESIGARSARALRDAVQRLRRKKGMTLERWVNFVHFGG